MDLNRSRDVSQLPGWFPFPKSTKMELIFFLVFYHIVATAWYPGASGPQLGETMD